LLAFAHRTLPRPDPSRRSPRAIILGASASFVATREFVLKRSSKHETLDLAEMRRQITALRSRHSENLRITYLLNRLLIKMAYLSEPESAAHAQQLREAFARTMTDIEKRVTNNVHKPSGKASK
jgi:hypothetical protein